jgi:hypothetical protein
MLPRVLLKNGWLVAIEWMNTIGQKTVMLAIRKTLYLGEEIGSDVAVMLLWCCSGVARHQE